jgi:ribonuclease P protein component
MNKKYIISKNEEIGLIVKNGNKNNSNFFIIYNIESNEEYNMYCVSVSKKIGKAHTRNLIKRRVKDILMKNKLFLKRKYVIIVKKEALDASYEDLTKVLINQIKGAK